LKLQLKIPGRLSSFGALKHTAKGRNFLHFLLENLSMAAVLEPDGWAKASSVTSAGACQLRTSRSSTFLFDCAPGEGNLLQLWGFAEVSLAAFPPFAKTEGWGTLCLQPDRKDTKQTPTSGAILRCGMAAEVGAGLLQTICAARSLPRRSYFATPSILI
jgi:hypothetical protein